MNKKKFKTGLVIGKFYPLHKGHQYLIETGMKRCRKLTVIICQTENYKIPVEIRSEWIKEIYPQVDLKILHHDVSMDDVSTDKSRKWAKLTLGFLGFVPEAVFTSENYGGPYANFLGSTHILVDLDRKKFSTSGEKIRKNPLENWEFLSEPTRAYYAKRVVILGAESTGTTTLAKDLAQYYKTVWVPEYGRFYYEGKQSTKNSSTWVTSEFVHIAKQQNKMEDSLSIKSNKIFICDTDSFATAVWHKRYVGHMARELESIIRADLNSLYILTDTDIPFTQDGTRDGEHIRQWMHDFFIEEMNKRKLNYIIVSGSEKERLIQAIAGIKNHFEL